MPNIFPRWSNWIPIKVIFAVMILGSGVSSGVWYYFTPKYTRVGYQPVQPIPFDHTIHVKQVGLDCRYCHIGVETSHASTVPPTQICMNCHKQIKADSPKLAELRKSWETGNPVPWVRVHQTPDYVYFNHSVHVARGVSCVSCHGKVNEMKVVYQHEPQSMSWCLDCHRHPEKQIRPREEVYNLDWQPEEGVDQEELGAELVHKLKIRPPLDCSGCHR